MAAFRTPYRKTLFEALYFEYQRTGSKSISAFFNFGGYISTPQAHQRYADRGSGEMESILERQ